jgi:hypothetical protein
MAYCWKSWVIWICLLSTSYLHLSFKFWRCCVRLLKHLNLIVLSLKGFWLWYMVYKTDLTYWLYPSSGFFYRTVSILSGTAGNKLISKVVGISYSWHMPQRAGYQGSFILVAAWTPPHSKNAFRNTSHYILPTFILFQRHEIIWRIKFMELSLLMLPDVEVIVIVTTYNT